jgi:hypothetical protein
VVLWSYGPLDGVYVQDKRVECESREKGREEKETVNKGRKRIIGGREVNVPGTSGTGRREKGCRSDGRGVAMSTLEFEFKPLHRLSPPPSLCALRLRTSRPCRHRRCLRLQILTPIRISTNASQLKDSALRAIGVLNAEQSLSHGHRHTTAFRAFRSLSL